MEIGEELKCYHMIIFVVVPFLVSIVGDSLEFLPVIEIKSAAYFVSFLFALMINWCY